MYTAPTIANFKSQFVRDFPYGTDPTVAVLDQDIFNAFNVVDITINPCLWPNQTAYQLGYLLLAAHNLVLNIRSSSQGLSGQYNWMQNSKSAGGVNEAFQIPQRVIDNPDFMAYMKTNYGAQYLNILWPYLCGQMFAVAGRTKP